METASTWSPSGAYCLCQAAKRGNSIRQGAHQVAQKFSRTTLPSYAERLMRTPLRSAREKGGAGRFSKVSDADTRPAAPKHSNAARATIRRMPTRSLRFLRRVALRHPVGAKVVRDVERADMREAHLVQQLPRGSDVGALVPGAATAVDHDRPAAGQGGHACAECVESGGTRSGTGILGAGDVRFVEEHM